MTAVRLEPTSPRSLVTHSTTALPLIFFFITNNNEHDLNRYAYQCSKIPFSDDSLMLIKYRALSDIVINVID